MPTYSFDGGEAFRLLDSNPASRWHRAGADPRDAAGGLAVQRMQGPLFTPMVRPAFRIGRKDRVFAIGSCFARGIEKVLGRKGFRVESAATEFDAFELRAPGSTPLGFTNKYTTAAIANELGWALDPARSYPEESFVPLGGRRWVDTHTNPALEFVDLERTRERRCIITEVTARIARCRIVVITLGLVEAWLDKKTGLYMNMAPLPEMMEREPDRYAFHVLGFDENRRSLGEIHGLLARFGRPDVEIAVTVSPVPLMATFSGRDVVTANTYSKSVLRAAAEEWAQEKENVHYFPSYEIAMNSRREVVFEEDGRHIRGEVTRHIMNLFTSSFVTGSKIEKNRRKSLF